MTLDHPANNPIADIAQALQQNLASIGIKVNLIRAEARQVTTKVRLRHHQLAIGQWGSDYFDPNSNAQWFCENLDNSDATPLRSGAWIAGWMNKDATNRALAAASEPDGATRIAIYQQLERDLRGNSPYAMMLQAKQIAVTHADVTGLTLGALSDRTSFARLAKA